MAQRQHTALDASKQGGVSNDPNSRIVLVIPRELKWALKQRAAQRQMPMKSLLISLIEREVANDESGTGNA